MAKAKTDPLAKRQQETYWQWRARIARAKQDQRDRSDSLVTPEALQHGEYEDGFIMHIETGTFAKGTRNRQHNPLAWLHSMERITGEQYEAALRIAGVAEAIQRAACVRSASMEARVDCSGSSRDPLIETLHQVRMERAYTVWRNRLPFPKRMVIDMILADRKLKATARKYGVGWPRAFRLLTNALDEWPHAWRDAADTIEQEDVDRAHARLTRARECG